MSPESPAQLTNDLTTLKKRLDAHMAEGNLWRATVANTVTFPKGSIPDEFRSAFAYFEFEDPSFDLSRPDTIKISARAVGYLAAGRPERLKAEIDLVCQQVVFHLNKAVAHPSRLTPRPVREAFSEDRKFQDALDEWEVFHEEVLSLVALAHRSQGVEHYLRRGISLWLAGANPNVSYPGTTPALNFAPSIYLAAFKRMASRTLKDLLADAEGIELNPRDPAAGILAAATPFARRLATGESQRETKAQFWLAIAKAASDNGVVTGGDGARQALTAPRLDMPFARVKVNKTDPIAVIAAKLLFAVLALDAADPGWELRPLACDDSEDY